MKKLLYVLVALSLLYIILCFAGPKKFGIERSITINKSVETYKERLLDFKWFHQNWSPWAAKDPTMTVNYSGTAGQVGHKMDWAGNDKVRSGSMEIMKFNKAVDTVNVQLVFGKSDGKGNSWYYLQNKGDSSRVSWGMEMPVPFFGRGFMLFMNMEKMMAPDFETGLRNLKTTVEEMKEEKKELSEDDFLKSIQEVEWPETYYAASKKETVDMNKMTEYFEKQFPLIMKEMVPSSAEWQSAPSAIYYKFDEAAGKADISAGVKVKKGVKLKGFETVTFPVSKVILLPYYGSYDKISSGHMAIDKYMKEKGYANGVAIEEYMTDPGKEPDTAKWLTNIYYIVKK